MEGIKEELRKIYLVLKVDLLFFNRIIKKSFNGVMSLIKKRLTSDFNEMKSIHLSFFFFL